MIGEKDQFVSKEERERKNLELFVRRKTVKISEDLAGSIMAVVPENACAGFFPLRFEQHVLGERTVDIELPDGAWEWLKLALAPRWLLARYPIRVRKMNIVRIYPEIQPLRGRSSYEVLMPDSGGHPAGEGKANGQGRA